MRSPWPPPPKTRQEILDKLGGLSEWATVQLMVRDVRSALNEAEHLSPEVVSTSDP